MVSSFILIPGVCIENLKTKEYFMIKYRTNATITLENISTGELTTEPMSVINLGSYKVVEVISENK